MINTAAILLGLLPIILGQSLIGYDCGGKGLNITRISLLEVGNCDITRKLVKTSSVRIRLHQTKRYSDVGVIQCKVEITRTITHCGFNSWGSPVSGGILNYLEDLTREQCELLHSSGQLVLGPGIIIAGVPRNSTVDRSVVLAGRVTSDASCKGTQYADAHATYDDVVVQASVRITLANYSAKADRNINLLHLNSGVNCVLNKGRCIDNVGGHTYWTDSPINTCNFEQYDLLYDGYVSKTVAEGDEKRPIYTLISADATFSIMGSNVFQVCGIPIVTTEHPKLFIRELWPSDPNVSPGKLAELYHTNKQLIAENIDFMTYVNSKIVYVERHVRTQMENLYYEMTNQKCLLEQKVIKNLLSIASIKPDEFAYNLMDGPGYMAVVTGKVIRLVKCAPVEVTLRRSDLCYMELSVLRGNQTYFLTPKTHVLLRKGTETSCDDVIPSSYKIGDVWYEITPKAFKSNDPEVLQPSISNIWRYEDPGSLATAGIYTQKELNNLQERILFSMEQPAVLNVIARAAAGHKTSQQGLSMDHLIDPEAIERMVDGFWYRAWNKFSVFGTTVAGAIGIFVAIRVVKGLLDTILQGVALHSVFGWSLHLLGAIFTSLTHFLLHMESRGRENTTRIYESEGQNLITPAPQQERPQPTPRPITLADSCV